MILVVGLIYSFLRWNDYREKELVNVLDAEKIEEFLYLEPNTENPILFHEEVVSESESIEELVDFFTQYKVKKVSSRNFSSKYPEEQFNFQIKYTDNRNTIPSMIERDVLLIDNSQYIITNGPVDYGWIETFLAKQKNS